MSTIKENRETIQKMIDQLHELSEEILPNARKAQGEEYGLWFDLEEQIYDAIFELRKVNKIYHRIRMEKNNWKERNI